MGFDSWSIRDKIVLIWALVIASIAVLFVCVSLGNLFSENSSIIASWAQAIVSMIAIIAGAWGLNWQTREAHRLQKHKEEEDSRRLMQRRYLVLTFKFSEVHEFCKTTVGREDYWGEEWSGMRVRFRQIRDDFRNINFGDLPTPYFITQLIVLNSAFNMIDEFLEIEMPDPDGPEMDEFREAANELLALSKKLCDYSHSRSLELCTEAERRELLEEMRVLRGKDLI
jgi:hypothetical protein